MPNKAYVCTDCNTAHNNGMAAALESMEYAGIYPDTVPLNRFDNDNTVEHYAANYDAETGDGVNPFSMSPCAGCGAHHAGYRYRYALWLSE